MAAPKLTNNQENNYPRYSGLKDAPVDVSSNDPLIALLTFAVAAVVFFVLH